MRYLLLLAGALLTFVAPLRSQTLSEEQLAAIRRGAARALLPDRPTRVPLVGKPTLPLVEARINGAGPFRLLVDLGSNVIVLRRNVVDAAGVEIILDRERSDIVRADALSIGEATFCDVWIAAYDELDVDGVAGYNLLSLAPFTLDLSGGHLLLGSAEVNENDEQFVVEGRLAYLPARIGEREILLNPDTGAAEEMTVPASWEGSLPIDGEIRDGPLTWNNQTGETRVRIGKLGADLRVGDVLLGRPRVYFNRDAESAWLGSGLLQHYVLAMDHKTRRYRLTAGTGSSR